jgi:hypothetical protein
VKINKFESGFDINPESVHVKIGRIHIRENKHGRMNRIYTVERSIDGGKRYTIAGDTSGHPFFFSTFLEAYRFCKKHCCFSSNFKLRIVRFNRNCVVKNCISRHILMINGYLQ